MSPRQVDVCKVNQAAYISRTQTVTLAAHSRSLAAVVPTLATAELDAYIGGRPGSSRNGGLVPRMSLACMVTLESSPQKRRTLLSTAKALAALVGWQLTSVPADSPHVLVAYKLQLPTMSIPSALELCALWDQSSCLTFLLFPNLSARRPAFEVAHAR